MLVVPLSPSQVEIMEWALDGAADYWRDQGEEDLLLPEVKGTSLYFIHDEEILDDLLYRIGTQYIEMTDQAYDISPQRRGSRIKAAETLFWRIKEAMNRKEPEGVPIHPHGLPLRLCNLLIRYKVETYEALDAWWESGKVHTARQVGPRMSAQLLRLLQKNTWRIPK